MRSPWTAAERASDDGDFGYCSAALPELIEAATRCGRSDVAGRRAAPAGAADARCRQKRALGVLARARALLSEGQAADALFLEAMGDSSGTRIRVELARAHLLYGEWLRRESRRVEARDQLRTARQMFSRFGTEAFAERARRELLATGETARKRTGRRPNPS